MENLLDLNWFLSTPFGKPFEGLDETIYDTAFQLAESQLTQVKCYCPKLYPTALAIKISLVLSQLAPSDDGAVDFTGSNTTGKIAMVVEDEVYDVKRKYELIDEEEQVANSSPAALLKNIIAQCRNPLKAGATLVRSLPNGDDCGCGPLNMVRRFGDKADN